MLRLHFTTSIVSILIAIVLISSEFAAVQSHDASVSEKFQEALDVPSNWNIAPSLKSEQKPSIDQRPTGNVQMDNLNDQFQNLGLKNSSVQVNISKNEADTRGKRFDMNFSNPDGGLTETKIKDSNSEVTTPRNVVLFLVAGTSNDKPSIMENLPLPVDVTGYLQSCDDSSSDKQLSLEDSLNSETKEKKCRCEHYLHANMAALLMWARYEREMSTGTVLSGNFTFPSVSRHRMTDQNDAKKFSAVGETDMRPEVRKGRQDIHDSWEIINTDKSRNHISSIFTSSNINEAKSRSSNTMWDVFDEFSKIRLALFRKLLEFLGSNMISYQDTYGSQKSNLLESNFSELVTNAIRELKSVPNTNGYMLIVAAHESEAVNIVELLRSEISGDTLLVVTETCSHDGNRVQFFAQGPGSVAFHNVKTVWELPTIIRTAVDSGCHITGCKMRHHDMPNAIFKLQVHQNPIVHNSIPDRDKTSTDKLEALSNGNESINTKMNRVVSEVATEKFNLTLNTTSKF